MTIENYENSLLTCPPVGMSHSCGEWRVKRQSMSSYFILVDRFASSRLALSVKDFPGFRISIVYRSSFFFGLAGTFGRIEECLGGDFVFGAQLTAHLGACEYVLAIFVEFELVNHDIGRVDAQRDALAGGFVAGNALDVNDVFQTIDRGDLALTAFVGTTNDGDLVILADGDTADIVLLT